MRDQPQTAVHEVAPRRTCFPIEPDTNVRRHAPIGLRLKQECSFEKTHVSGRTTARSLQRTNPLHKRLGHFDRLLGNQRVAGVPDHDH